MHKPCVAGPDDARASRWRLLAECLAVAVGIVGFYSPHLRLDHMQSGGDFANLFWPMKELRLATLRDSGAFMLWNPYIFLGTPAAATMQHAVFYPPDYLFFWKSPLIGALNLYVLAHSVLCGLGAWFLARKAVRTGGAGAVFCGMAYPCTAWFWGAQEHINQIAAVAWMPWMIAVAWRWSASRMGTRRYVVWYSLLGALQFLAGHPQAAFYTHGAVAVLLIARVATVARGHRCCAAKYAVAGFGGAGLLTGLLVAVQLLPALEMSSLSYRQFQGDDPGYSLSFSMPPDILATYLQPNRFGSYLADFVDQRAYNEYGLYVGWTTLALAMVGLAAMARRRRKLAALFGGSIVLTVLMAMGGNVSLDRIVHAEFTEFPTAAFARPSLMQDVREEEAAAAEAPAFMRVSLHEVFIALVPPARGFRVPARVVVITALAWCLLAAAGLQAAARLLHSRASPAVARTALGLLIAAGWLALYIPSKPQKFRHPKDAIPVMLEREMDRAERSAATIDGRFYRLTLADLDLIVAERQRSSEEAWELRTGGNSAWQRWMRWQENNNAAVPRPAVEGYEEGLAPIVRTKDFMFSFNRNLRQARPDEQFLALLGVNRIFSDLVVDTSVFPLVQSESRSIRTMYAVPAAKGAAFWAAQAEGIDFAALEGPYYKGGALMGRRATEALSFGTAKHWNDPMPLLKTDVTNPNTVRIASADGTVPGDAILSMAWAPGWVFADGTSAKWMGAAHVRIPTAHFHDGVATMRYEPRTHRMGLFLTAAGLMVLAMMATIRGGRR